MAAPARDSVSRRTVTLWLVAIIALGAFLRLSNLSGTCMWIDEIVFVNLSNPDSGCLSVWSKLYEEYKWRHHAPLAFFIEGVYVSVVKRLGLPLDETVYRTPAALMGIASVFVLYLLARRMFNERVGLLAAFLFSTSFFHVYYSREAYVYSPFVLCALLSWYWLVRIYDDWKKDGRATARSLIWYSVTTALTVQMVLAGVMFLLCEFLALVASAWSSPMRRLTNTERSKLLRPVVLAYVAAWIPFLPFLWQLAHYVSADNSAVHPEGVLPFLKMLGEMGWSSQWIPLVLFLICIVAGVGCGLADREQREPVILCLILGVGSALGTGYLERLGRYESRYFIGLVPVLLLFVALAWSRACGFFQQRLPHSFRSLVWLLPGLALLIGQIPFYNQLYQLPSKLLNSRGIAEWLVANTPVGATYVLDNVYVRREVPMFYPTPGRNAASPDAHLSAEDYAGMREFVKDLFRRFPDCYFVDTQHALFAETDGSPSEWLRTSFRRHVRIENPALLKLVAWGIYPSSCFYPDMVKLDHPGVHTDIYFNTTEDIQEAGRAAGLPAIVQFGPEWEHCQIPAPQGGVYHWKGLRGDGRIFVHGLSNAPTRVSLRIRCASYQAAQTVTFTFDQMHERVDFPADAPRWIELAPVEIKPGHNVITVTKAVVQRTNEVVNFMVYEVRVEPQLAP